jgi:hypothetical protein
LQDEPLFLCGLGIFKLYFLLKGSSSFKSLHNEKRFMFARKYHDDWFIGAINNHQSRKISIPSNFLGDGEYVAEIYSDAIDVKLNPNNLTQQTHIVNKNGVISLQLERGGGAAIKLKRK